jgi:hypothetical protein
MSSEQPNDKQAPESLFEFYERQYGLPADEMRSGCRNWLIIFAIASTVLAVACWSIWKQLS